jgi:hypothetical protein
MKIISASRTASSGASRKRGFFLEPSHLEVLHDHYKETFSYIRYWEKHRDTLFLVLIGLLGLLFLEVQYPANLQKCVKEINAGATLYINAFPMPIITSATWTIFLAIMLRYCQSTITVERQYKYLHKLEKTMSSFFNEDYIYQREGRSYNWNYPVFSQWVYLFYVFIFPVIIIVLQIDLLFSEYKSTRGYFFIYDAIMAVGVLLSLVLYRGAQIGRKLSKDFKKTR